MLTKKWKKILGIYVFSRLLTPHSLHHSSHLDIRLQKTRGKLTHDVDAVQSNKHPIWAAVKSTANGAKVRKHRIRTSLVCVQLISLDYPSNGLESSPSLWVVTSAQPFAEWWMLESHWFRESLFVMKRCKLVLQFWGATPNAHITWSFWYSRHLFSRALFSLFPVQLCTAWLAPKKRLQVPIEFIISNNMNVKWDIVLPSGMNLSKTKKYFSALVITCCFQPSCQKRDLVE